MLLNLLGPTSVVQALLSCSHLIFKRFFFYLYSHENVKLYNNKLKRDKCHYLKEQGRKLKEWILAIIYKYNIYVYKLPKILQTEYNRI